MQELGLKEYFAIGYYFVGEEKKIPLVLDAYAKNQLDLSDVNRVLELSSIKEFFDKYDYVNAWNDDYYRKYKELSRNAEKEVRLFFQSITENAIVPIYNVCKVIFWDEFWKYFYIYKVYDKISAEHFKEIADGLRIPPNELLKNKNLVEKFDTQITEMLKNPEYGARFIVDYYMRKDNGKTKCYFPKSLTKEDKYCSYELGERLSVNEEYLEQAFLVARKVLIGTVWGLRKTADDMEELNSYLFEYGYTSLKNEEWDLAEYIYSMLLKEEKQTDADKICEQVNLWIAIKNKSGIEKIESEVRALDVSAMKNQFFVAKHALLDEFDQVSIYLEEAIKKEIPAWCVKDWPLLNQYRESEQYALFVEKHKDLFDTNGYESANEAIGDSEDVISELGDDLEIKLDYAI